MSTDTMENNSENRTYCPKCGHEFERSEWGLDYETGMIGYECEECGWCGNEHEVVDRDKVECDLIDHLDEVTDSDVDAVIKSVESGDCYEDALLKRVDKVKNKDAKKLLEGQTQARTLLDILYRGSRQYTACWPPVNWQFAKVFNHSMGALAFARAVPEDRVLLVNRGLSNKRELRRFENVLKLFRGWRLVEVSLGYPEWYNIRDLYWVWKK